MVSDMKVTAEREPPRPPPQIKSVTIELDPCEAKYILAAINSAWANGLDKTCWYNLRKLGEMLEHELNNAK